RAHRAPCRAARSSYRPRKSARRRAPSRWLARARRDPTDIARRARPDHPPLRATSAEPGRPRPQRDAAARRHGLSRGRRARTPKRSRFRRHLEWQDNDAERARFCGRRPRTYRDDRGRRRASASAAKRRRAPRPRREWGSKDRRDRGALARARGSLHPHAGVPMSTVLLAIVGVALLLLLDERRSDALMVAAQKFDPRAHSRLRESRIALPGLVDAVAAALSSGLSVQLALSEVAPTLPRALARPTERAAASMALGASVDEALGAYAGIVSGEDL